MEKDLLQLDTVVSEQVDIYPIYPAEARRIGYTVTVTGPTLNVRVKSRKRNTAYKRALQITTRRLLGQLHDHNRKNKSDARKRAERLLR